MFPESSSGFHKDAGCRGRLALQGSGGGGGAGGGAGGGGGLDGRWAGAGAAHRRRRTHGGARQLRAVPGRDVGGRVQDGAVCHAQPADPQGRNKRGGRGGGGERMRTQNRHADTDAGRGNALCA
eukprot:COSAG01_NODE_3096_length_6591_cov_5.863986_4_plen_124_part_00